eukprot:704392-Rhodomonas_salina.1
MQPQAPGVKQATSEQCSSNWDANNNTQQLFSNPDNWACIHMSRNAVLHHKTKHIDVRVYHLLDLVLAKIIELLKIGTHNM